MILNAVNVRFCVKRKCYWRENGNFYLLDYKVFFLQ